MKNIFKLTFCFLLVACASNDDNLLEDITYKGGFIQFEETPANLNYNFLNIQEFVLEAPLIDPNNNAIGYSLTLNYNGTAVENFYSINSFPAAMSIDIQMILDALGLTIGDIDETAQFNFVATVETPEGFYSGLTPDFDYDDNEEVGGNTAVNLLGSGYKNAMDFTVNFFIPPPKKYRGTSFEEPFAAADAGADYTRTDVDVSREMLNNTGERYVMHVATGTGENDEIGFRAFFEDNGSGGFTNEEIGVTMKTEDVGSYPDGVQGYQLEDVDGLWRLEFDKVTIPSELTKTGIQIKFFPRSTSWESSDTLHIYVDIESPAGVFNTIDLVDLSGSGINNLEDKWNTASTGFLDGVVSYKLFVATELNSSSEEMYFDEMLVYVPED